jgi:dCMP deaminase
MIIGLTGPIGSGKGTVAEYLSGKGFTKYSLSDAIRDEVAKMGEWPTRDNLIKTGNELREKHGFGILAERIIEKIAADEKTGRKDFLVDSIRNPAEVKALRRRDDFFLVSIDAPKKARFERITARGRENDPKTWADFLKTDSAEVLGTGEGSQRILDCMRMADAVIINDSADKSLFIKLDILVHDLIQKEMQRPDSDEYFLKIASVVAERSTCLRRHVGAVAVKSKQIISTGYNGAPSGAKDCMELGCLRNQLGIKSGTEQQICRAVHAEQNAIIQAAIHGQDISGATVYCTHSPCIICAKMLVNAKIKKFVTYTEYSEDAFKALFDEAGIEIVKKKRPSDKIKFMD